ncbi:hypothetical protein NE237_022809 [Protea cynaroides]|uniref:DUF4228 domain-containing protein n=1 Tax=Protea cynaroides TaxID=273540 RepID=A0A9Q0K5L8_9MAGN|nr:hypothetical protein NE237_022809 [Protea cynaroides]
MGGCLSCRSVPASLDVIRVVHLSGLVEDYDHPVTAGEITGKPPKYFLCASTEYSFSSSLAFQPDIQLQRGQIYFLLPLSSLQWEASDIDFACLATRLTKLAKRSGSPNSRHSQSNPVLGRSRSAPERVLSTSEEDTSVGQNSVVTLDREKMSVRAGTWKPFLATINEKSFGRRSESDLHSPMIPTPR